MIERIWDTKKCCYTCGMHRNTGHKPNCLYKEHVEGQSDMFDVVGEPSPLLTVVAEPPVVEQDEPTGEAIERFPSVNWAEAFGMDFTQIDWLPGRFMERGQQVALVGDGKVGKSLFVHEWLWRAVTGRSFLNDESHDPLKVLYFDRENSLRDIVTRMQAFGATPEDLENFDYRMFPKFSGGLDAGQLAAVELLSIVEEVKPDIVVLDTVSRFISGKENDSDTWLQLYGRIHAPLKDQGIACVRLDHMGKDVDRGSRGSSAKSQDVDHVWEMTRTDVRHDFGDGIEAVITNILMKRTHTRTGLGDDSMQIIRTGRKAPSGMWLPGGTRHERLSSAQESAQDQKIRSEARQHVDILLMKGVPAGMGRDGLKKWCADHRYKLPGKNEVVAEIVKGIKEYFATRPALGEGD
ncbi:AAA family ATPase [Streptomyces sp. NPDC056707]|uniref:AAA family ATPase n=1 Tax=Streptomyces sp. NPDC056707 TaxID=3345919 RepID=UPI0036C14B74